LRMAFGTRRARKDAKGTKGVRVLRALSWFRLSLAER
jgi:hypothetical protein